MFTLIFPGIKISADKNSDHTIFLKNENLNHNCFAILLGLPTPFQPSDSAWEEGGGRGVDRERGGNTTMTQFRFLYW